MPKIDDAIVAIREIISSLDGNMTTLSTNLQQTSDAAHGAIQRAGMTLKPQDGRRSQGSRAAIVNIRGLSDPDSVTFYELGRSLREVSAAARSLRLLSNSIERNPRALIFGKPELRGNESVRSTRGNR